MRAQSRRHQRQRHQRDSDTGALAQRKQSWHAKCLAVIMSCHFQATCANAVARSLAYVIVWRVARNALCLCGVCTPLWRTPKSAALRCATRALFIHHLGLYSANTCYGAVGFYMYHTYVCTGTYMFSVKARISACGSRSGVVLLLCS